MITISSFHFILLNIIFKAMSSMMISQSTKLRCTQIFVQNWGREKKKNFQSNFYLVFRSLLSFQTRVTSKVLYRQRTKKKLNYFSSFQKVDWIKKSFLIEFVSNLPFRIDNYWCLEKRLFEGQYQEKYNDIWQLCEPLNVVTLGPILII